MGSLINKGMVLIDLGNQELLWHAVRNRDPRYYSRFVYAVKSTKIFCRPTCPSRKPRIQSQVLFFDSPTLARLKMDLKSGNSVRKSTYGVGYNTSGWLYFRPDEKLGMSPLKYKSGAEGLHIEYAISSTPIGRLLVATTERGVCFVSLADSNEILLARLHAEFPKARIEESSNYQNNNLSISLEKITDYITTGTDLQKSTLPLDIKATAFEWLVWKELRRIPYGRVRSYSEVARRIGFPSAARAVANACASNPVPLIIPCHRVVPKTGGIGNYGLGVERKKILLKKEGVDLAEFGERNPVR